MLDASTSVSNLSRLVLNLPEAYKSMSEVTEQTIISILPFTCTAQIGEEFSHITDLLKHYLNNYLILLLFSGVFLKNACLQISTLI